MKGIGLAAFGIWLAMACSPILLAAESEAQRCAVRDGCAKSGAESRADYLQADGAWLA
ncbi:MAG TPA: hypothetical protein VHU82_13445 [Vicinamibacterales bacterium]|jgi:hypothetical protein|nr:hypothetical protein [Vicinamibacterales bacterium]